jgi:hypothetical protein
LLLLFAVVVLLLLDEELELTVSPLKIISCFPCERGLRKTQLPSATACVEVLAGNPRILFAGNVKLNGSD